MADDPIGSLVRRAEEGSASVTASDLALIERSAEYLLDAARDTSLLNKQLNRLCKAAASSASPDGGGSAFRNAGIHVLRAVTDALLRRESPTELPDRETVQLAADLRSRKHALGLFRLIARNQSRPADLERATGLNGEQVHRVLRWGVANALLVRWMREGSSHYRLSSLGELALDANDQPQWVSMATTLVRLTVQARLRHSRRTPWEPQGEDDPVVRKAAMLTGLTVDQTARSLTELALALHPAPGSALARALRAMPGTRQEIIVSPPVWHQPYIDWNRLERPPHPYALTRWLGSPRLDSLAESRVLRCIERAGVSTRQLKELLPQVYLRATRQHRPYYVPLDRPIVSIASPSLNPMTAGLLFEYGAPVYFARRPTQSIVWCGSGRAGIFSHGPDDDSTYALLLRLYDNQTAFSHFVLGGNDPAGTYGACRYFDEHVEELLHDHPEQSFGLVLVFPRSYSRIRGQDPPDKKVYPTTFQTDAGPTVTPRLDMRYIDAMPLIAEALAVRSEHSGVAQCVRHAISVLATETSFDFETGPLIAGILDPGNLVTRRTRDLALLHGARKSFEELLVFLLAALLTFERDENPESSLNGVLESRLKLAPYAATAVKKLAEQRGWGECLLKASRGDPAGVERLAVVLEKGSAANPAVRGKHAVTRC